MSKENQKVEGEKVDAKFIAKIVKGYLPPFKEIVQGGIDVMVAANTADFSHTLKEYKKEVIENQCLKKKLSNLEKEFKFLEGKFKESEDYNTLQTVVFGNYSGGVLHYLKLALDNLEDDREIGELKELITQAEKYIKRDEAMES